MKRSTPSILFLLLSFTLLFSACTPAIATVTPQEPVAPATEQPVEATQAPVIEETDIPSTEISIIDSLGREINFPEMPSRIVYGGKSSLMIADALYLFPGVSDQIIAVGDTNQNFGNFIQAIDPNFDKKIMLGGQANVEEIVANNPDAVLLKSFLSSDYQEPLDQLGVPAVFLELETVEQYNRDIKTLGIMLNQEERAQEIVDYYNNAVKSIEQTVASVSEEEKPDILVLYYKESDGVYTYNVPPVGWMQTTSVITAGGNPVWLENAATNGWNKIGFEQLAAWDADQIYVIAYRENASDLVATLLEDAQWQSLSAVKNGQVYGYPGDFYSWDQPDTRWVLGLKWLAWRIHPELFPEFDTQAEVRSFFKEMYMLDDAMIDTAIMPILRGDITD